MIYGLKGKIFALDKNKAMIEVNGVIYEFLASHPDIDFAIGKDSFVYTHEVIAEDEHYLVGFPSLEEKKAFSALIEVKGIGPKTALNALSATNPSDFFKAVQANNTAYLKKLPGIGTKAASQIILDLKGKLIDSDSKGNPAQFDAVKQVLRQMGYKNKSIDDALAKIQTPSDSEEEIIRLALKNLNQGKK